MAKHNWNCPRCGGRTQIDPWAAGFYMGPPSCRGHRVGGSGIEHPVTSMVDGGAATEEIPVWLPGEC